MATPSPKLPGVLAEPELAQLRAAALHAWRVQNPSLGADEDALLEAASLAAFIDTDAGPRFEPAPFAELVDFIAELPF